METTGAGNVQPVQLHGEDAGCRTPEAGEPAEGYTAALHHFDRYSLTGGELRLLGDDVELLFEQAAVTDDGTPDAGAVGPLECPTAEVEEGEPDYVTDAPGRDGDAVAVVREWLAESLEPSDELTVAPPELRRPTTFEAILVVRGGAPVAVVQLGHAADDGLLITGYEACPGAIVLP